MNAEQILQGFGGILQLDGYAGYDGLTRPSRTGGAPITVAHCWAQPSIRRDTAQAAAKRSPARLRDHVVYVNNSPRPGVPRVEHLALIGPVGVL